MTRLEARQQILALFDRRETLDYWEIFSETTGLDFELILEICDELEEECILAAVDDDWDIGKDNGYTSRGSVQHGSLKRQWG